jgi:hypothetical protein
MGEIAQVIGLLGMIFGGMWWFISHLVISPLKISIEHLNAILADLKIVVANIKDSHTDMEKQLAVMEKEVARIDEKASRAHKRIDEITHSARNKEHDTR